jgi:MFS family permease
VLVNGFVGAMVGLERTILPAIAEQEFGMVARTAILSFIVVFGITKAFTNYLAGRLSDRFGRKHVLVGGWLVAIPVPFLLMWAPDWNWILAANALLGVSQGLTWSTTVIMKIDLAGPQRRGLAMGLNEFAGYFAVALSALATGYVAARYGLRPEPFYLGVGFVAIGLLLSAVLVRETRHHVAAESRLQAQIAPLSAGEVFKRTTWRDRDLSSVSQAGLVNNLNDGMAWGLFPLFFAAAGMDLARIGTLAAIYLGPGPAVHRRLVGPGGAQAVDRRRHVDPGRGHRGNRAVVGLPGLRHRRRDAGHRHRHGLPDPAGRDRRRRPPRLARLGGGRVPAVARPRLRRRRGRRRHHRRRLRPACGAVAGGVADPGFGRGGGGADAGDVEAVRARFPAVLSGAEAGVARCTCNEAA